MDKKELKNKLLENHKSFIQFVIGLTSDEFSKSNNEKWTAGQQLEHIFLGVKPVRQILSLPKFLIKLICGQARPEEMDEIYRWLYDNVALFGDEAIQDKAILIIKQGLVDHALVMDPEINLAATLIRLAHL